MKTKSTNLHLFTKILMILFTGILFLLLGNKAKAQLGIYQFTGVGTCPVQSPGVTTQPANAVFSNISSANITCNTATNIFNNANWSNSATFDPTKYIQFTITPSSGYALNLTTLSFTQFAGDDQASNSWYLRSSIDNYSGNIDEGVVTTFPQTPVVNLPATGFTNIGAVTFRIYCYKIKTPATFWAVDNITVNGSTIEVPPVPANPTSNSPQCIGDGVTINFNGSPAVGENWYWQTSATGTSTANSASSYTVFTPGPHYLRAQKASSLGWSLGAASITVALTPNVTTPVFTMGAGSIRCRGVQTVTYTASSANYTSLTYSLDAASLTAGNTINPATGAVTYVSAWSSNSIITATAMGCGGPFSANHTVTVTPDVSAPLFTLGALSQRCVNGNTVTYTATASNSTAIVYSLDPVSLAGNNTINSVSGAVNYDGNWVGTSVISATAAGCNGPVISNHTVTTNGNVTTPVFVLGADSYRCHAAETITYTANTNNASSLIYSLDAASITGGNSINASTGAVTYVNAWTGTSTITATAAGCTGPKTRTHTVTSIPSVATPVFDLGATSIRCQVAGNVTYEANASYSASKTYSLDALSISGGNIINSTTGAVTYHTNWSGTSIITVSATGCNGPTTATHTVTVTPSVTTPVFTLGSTSIRCQGAGTVTYDATASNTTGITYALNGASISGGNSINAATGAVTYAATWSGTSIITATAAGCSPKTAIHTVTITPTVGTPVFTLGSVSARCLGAQTITYTATATNNTGLTYSLDATSLANGNTINPATGAVSFTAGWNSNSIITVSATGCNGPSSSSHTVSVTPNVATPVFSMGAVSERCVNNNSVTYTATAANSTSIVYSLDAASLTGGNNINSSTGKVDWHGSWIGTSIITATGIGCNGPTSAIHTVTINPNVTTPVYVMGNSSTRCHAAETITYTVNVTNAVSLTYSLDAASLAGGNTINAATGAVTYLNSWNGTSTITAMATGCDGPKTKTHIVTSIASVEAPVFAWGATSTRCQKGETTDYESAANYTSGIVYTLDAASLAAGNTIVTTGNAGRITFTAAWSGTSIVTATAAGCYGPLSSTHTITTTATVGTPVFAGGTTSIRCQGAGPVNYNATASNSTAITYSLNGAAITGGNTINASTGDVTYAAGWTGATIITATATGCNGPKTATHTVTITPTVSTPIFTLGATSIRCQGANTVTYTANATNNTGITYSLDASSIAAGNGINTATGAVTYMSDWTGTSIITTTATGCNGPKTTIHTVTITPTVGTPTFTLGATSVRCQGGGSVAYTATASNSTSISYSLDAASTTGGNTINAITGTVAYAAGWSGTTIITATAAGCNGPASATHTVTLTPTVGVPVFSGGASSGRCQGASTVTYTATATNNTGITYSLDAASITAGNSINATTGVTNYVSTWSGTSVITASATGCNGPLTSTHTVTITSSVGVPVFAIGLQSVRTQGAATTSYAATASTNTGLSYELDASSLAGGNTINTATGAVTWSAGWSGVSAITATATGCNGPTSASHIVNANPLVVQMPLYLSTPGQILDRNDPVATNSTITSQTLPISAVAPGVVVDATSTGVANAGPVTVAHTTGTGGYRLMLVGISQKNKTVTSVTYGGTALTLVGDNNINGNARMAIYKLLNPSSGTANVVVNFSSNPDKGAVVNVTTFTGVHQATPLGTFVTFEDNAANPSITVPSAPGELVYDVVSKKNEFLTVGSGQNQIWNVHSGWEIYGAGSTRGGSASTTMSWTASSSDFAIGAVSIKPSENITNITFTQDPSLCNVLIIKAQTLQFLTHVNITGGTMPVTPAITAVLKYDSINVITLTNPVYNATTKILSWTENLGADVTVPVGKALELKITSLQPGVEFQIEYNSISKPSRISLLPVSTYIDFQSFDVYTAPYPGGTKRISGNVNTTYYVRAKVTTPFGYKDITGMNLKINPPGNTVAVNCIDSSTCSRTYEYPWTTSASTGVYYMLATATEGYENLIKNSDLLSFDVCSVCPPVALNDSATGAGGAPLIVNVLSNDYDPNNNIHLSTLGISVQPNNGTAFISNNKVVYLPNGSFAGRDTLTYQICDSTSLCITAQVYFTINPFLVDPCSEATTSHVYYLPFAETQARMALDSSTNSAMPSNNIRTVISMKMPYPGMMIVWDEWEDGYESNALNPLQLTTKVWGDGNPYNGIAPGYATDIIPAGGNIVLDNTMPTNPRVPANIFFDGRDKIFATGQITVTHVCGEPSIMSVQCMKTNVSPVSDFGTSFTIPVGQNFNSRDFRYTSLFIRAAQNNTTVEIDKDNNGTLETATTLNEGEVYLVNGGVLSGATVTSSAPIGIELHFGGVDGYSSRDVPVFPATWYSNTYYSPVPTTGRASNPADSNVVMLYNSLSRPLTINWSSGIPTSGSIVLPAKTVVRFPLAMSQTAAYKFVNPTGESFTAIQICDSYTPVGGGNGGTEFDWSFNLIAENRLTDFATIAWAPGSLDGTRNDNPVWVTPTANTTIYVKYDGNISGTTGLVSPCGMRYDVSYPVNALTHKRVLDASDKDQSGIAIYTCDNTKLAAVYGEDASTATVGNPSWDVGSTIQPFCKQKLIFANDDYARTMISQPVTITILINDFGFLAVVDPSSVNNGGVLQPSNGTVTINPNGTVIYTPNPGFIGKDTFEYNVCSMPTGIVCDRAMVYIDVSSCPAPANQNVVGGMVFLDKNDDGLNNDGGTGVAGGKVYLYVDGNCNTVIDTNELKDSVVVDGSGTYQFITYPEKFVEDDFDAGAVRSCANGSDGNAAWLSDWSDIGDPSGSFCNTSENQASTDCEIYKDGVFSHALRLKDNNVSATRTVNLTGASYAFLSFSYRRKSATLIAGEDVIVQASSNGSTFATIFTIAGNGVADTAYIDIHNQDITAFAAPVTYIRFLTNNNVDDADTVYIDNVKLQFLRYPQCYITRFEPSTVPTFHHPTTVLQHSFTASSSATCLSPYDFGIAKNTIPVSGTLFHDANGNTDLAVNGSAMGTVAATTVYAYLVDSTGKVAKRTTVNAGTGNYTFANADVMTNYVLRLSIISVNLGDLPPDTFISSLPGNWVHTGDAFGINNMAGTGLKPGQANGSVAVTTSTISITGVNFGVERLPDSDDRIVSYAVNTPDLLYDITGGLTGLDSEDGVLAAGKTYRITKLPVGAVLLYNNIAVALNQVITSFNPALLKIDPDDDTHSANFMFAARDAAGMYDATAAIITVNWNQTLPVKLISFSGRLNGSKTDLNWVTASEYNTKHYEVERSGDGGNFIKLATVIAKGNNNSATSYDLVDPEPLKGINYYRLKIVDNDGSFEYSKIVIIRIESSIQLITRVTPNPFTGKIDVYLTLTHATPVDFRFIDINGRMVFNKKVNGLKGFNWFTIHDLEKLPSAPYMLHMVTDDTKIVEKLIKK